MFFFPFFFLQICGNDPLPNRICIQCEQDVNVFFMKIKRFRALDKKWRDEVQHSNPMHPYLQLEQQYCVSGIFPLNFN